MNKGAQLVGDAILGSDFITLVLGGKAYTVKPPVIKTIAGAAKCLSRIGGEETFADVITSLQSLEDVSRALSWFIQGDETLAEDLAANITLAEATQSLESCLSLLSAKDFTTLSALAKNVAGLAAKPK